jgi:threonine/homoserine/homoserine lactone efflux protein
MDWTLIVIGIGIGIAVAAPIGPINVMVIRSVLQNGYRAGLATGAGAVLGDGVFALVAAFGITAISDFISHYEDAISLIGAAVLLALGLRTLLAVPAVKLDDLSRPEASGRIRLAASPPTGIAGHAATFGTTFLLTITNPATLMGFLFIFGSVGELAAHDSYLHAGMLVLSVMAGSFLWWVTLSAIVSRLRDRLTARGLRLVNVISGSLIAAFGVFVLVKVLWSLG